VTATAPNQRALRVPLPTAALAIVLLGAGLVLMYAGRHLTFFFDEWDFILGRRGSSVATYLDPHNGHLSLFPVVIYKVLLQLFGLQHYWPYRLAVVAFDLIAAAMLYVLAARRLGAWLVLLPTVLLALLGSAYQDLLWPFQIGFLGSVAAGLGALVALDRPGRRGDVIACLLIVYSVGSSGIGLAFLAACAVMLIAQRSEVQRFWVIAVPVVLFAIWYVGWGGGQHVTSDSILGSPQYVADAAAGAFAGITGLNVSYGPSIAVAGVIGIVVLVRGRGAIARPLLLAGLAGALVFWGLSAVARATEADPQASRYVYIGAVFILLVTIEASAGVRLSRGTIATLCVLTAAALAANLAQLRNGERGMRSADATVRASLAAVDIAAPVVPAAFLASPQAAPQIVAGPYLDAVHDFGTPALTVAELERAPANQQATADSTLVHAENITAAPTASAPCVSIAPQTNETPVAPAHTLTIRVLDGPASVYLRRFSATYPSAPLATLIAHRTYAIQFPSDRATTVPWIVKTMAAGRIAACVS
jgi:hypothetical protein